jgi:hypothetical protein
MCETAVTWHHCDYLGGKRLGSQKNDVKDVVFAVSSISSIMLDFWIGYEQRFFSITAIYRGQWFFGDESNLGRGGSFRVVSLVSWHIQGYDKGLFYPFTSRSILLNMLWPHRFVHLCHG